jgi:hypothetical protein
VLQAQGILDILLGCLFACGSCQTSSFERGLPSVCQKIENSCSFQRPTNAFQFGLSVIRAELVQMLCAVVFLAEGTMFLAGWSAFS